jgi:hypothetical protein
MIPPEVVSIWLFVNDFVKTAQNFLKKTMKTIFEDPSSNPATAV